MSKNKIISSNQISNSEPIFLDAADPARNIIDPKYVRIISNNNFDYALPPLISFDAYSPAIANTPKDGSKNTTSSLDDKIIQLDEIEKISGPTEYFVNGQKRFKFVIRVRVGNNPNIIGVKAEREALV